MATVFQICCYLGYSDPKLLNVDVLQAVDPPSMSDDCFFACQGFELDRWPIEQASVLISESINKLQYFVICLPDGSLGFRVVRNGASEDYETDIIVVEGSFKIVLSLNYAPLQPSVRINGRDIDVGPVGTRVKGFHHLHTASASAIPVLPEPSEYVPEHATHAEALLIRTLGDLSSASRSGDWYRLLKSSAPLRLLLLDGLLHKANDRCKMKIQFRVAARSQPPPVDFDKLWHPIEPHGCAPENIELITLDQFLKLRVFESRSIAITVKDVILAAAHSDGGVHYGPPRKIEEALLIELDHSTMHMGQAASRQLLKSICRLTVASTLPLATRIQNSF